MGTTAEKLQAILDSKADIKDAIEAKGVTVGDATLAEYAGKIGEIQQGMTEAPENDVNFYDYDGFRVASFTIAQAKALTQAEYNVILPPTHEGLIFQEWNWSWNDITTYNRRYIDIGANYVPTDGKTHVKFCPEEDNTNYQFIINFSAINKAVIVDWGDGTSEEKSVSNLSNRFVASHTYVTAGSYDCKIYSKNGDVTFSFLINNVNVKGLKYIKEINIGSENYSIEIFRVNVVMSISKQLTKTISCGYVMAPIIVIPKNTEYLFSASDCISNVSSIVSFPKVVPSFNGIRVVTNVARNGRTIIPEVAAGGSFAGNSVIGSGYAFILSLPYSFQYASQPPSNTFSSFTSLNTIDIVQGWTPNYSMSFSSSTCFSTGALVDFFNKLGTTTNTITLTFGSTNLDKLTAEEKAIATNKGYTLA